MPFERPTTFEAALAHLSNQELMPTNLRTWELSQLPLEIRQASMFSAGVTQVQLLDVALTQIKRIVASETDRATARLRIRQLLKILDYQPDPAEAGTLKDLSSARRVNLILDTNVDQAQGFGRHQAEQNSDTLFLFPAQELFRAGALPKEPRPWPEKWVRAGGKIYEGRLIARRDDPVWTKSLDAGGFNRFGTPYAPFDFNSGMRLRNVSRQSAIALGVIEENEPGLEPQVESLSENMQAEPRIGNERLRQAVIDSGLGTFDSDGRLIPS